MTQLFKYHSNSATDIRGTSVAIQNDPTKDMATVAKRRNKESSNVCIILGISPASD
jgi:hypothetical protein